jgi:glucose/arabinose dehydrogenase
VRWRHVALGGIAGGLLAAGIALTVAEARRPDGPSPSRLAADRACGPAGPPVVMGQIPPGALQLREVGHVDAPTTAVFAPDGSGDGLLGLRDGRVLRIVAGGVTDHVVLDLTHDTMQDGDGGLLALAYGPGGGWLYAYRADAARDDVLTAYPLDDAGQPDADRERVILTVDHPESLQHHGGALAVGPDELLYIGLGDGGGLGDPRENAQDTSVLLGKVLRIAPTPADPEPYRIPPDNPFVDDPDAAPEIWLVGVRNPFRIGADPETGDLWLGDVGQTCWEELDRLPTGADDAGGSNLGWDIVEGTHRFEGGRVPGRRLDPVQQHPHDDGWCGIVAGYVARASAVPALDGRMLYTDYCKGQVVALSVDAADGSAPRLLDTGLDAENPIAIVPGPHGHPWILTLGGEVLEVQPGD